jgi:hypothetical protein
MTAFSSRGLSLLCALFLVGVIGCFAFPRGSRNSSEADSKHYGDQFTLLAKKAWREPWRTRSELGRHIEERFWSLRTRIEEENSRPTQVNSIDVHSHTECSQ